MINQIQSEVLESFIGENGIYMDVIHDFAIDLGTKILYLERALEFPSDSFHHFLDKLYEPDYLELIRALKIINDLYWNNEVVYGDFGVRKTLNHYFMSLGPVDVPAFQERIKNRIQSHIQTWCLGNERIVPVQKRAREQKELEGALNMSWFEELKISVQAPPEETNEPRVLLANNQFLLANWDAGNEIFRAYRNETPYDFSQNPSQSAVALEELMGAHWSLSVSAQAGKINIYHSVSGHLVVSLEQQIANTYGLAVLANGALIIGSNERQEPVRVYEPDAGELIRCFGRGVGASHYLKELSENQVALGGVDKDTPLRIYNFETGTLTMQFSAGEALGSYDAFIARLRQVFAPRLLELSPLASLEAGRARREPIDFSFSSEESTRSEMALSLYPPTLMSEMPSFIYPRSSEGSLEQDFSHQESDTREASQETPCVFLECRLTNPSIRCVQRATFFCRQAERCEGNVNCCRPDAF